MLRGLFILGFAALLAACAPGSDKGESQTVAKAAPSAATVLDPASIQGVWRIVTLNGQAPLAGFEDGDKRRIPEIRFDAYSYGGTSGCNFFGGLGLLEGGRYYTYPGPQTAMGCGELSAQEDRITSIMATAPGLAIDQQGRLKVDAPRGAMTLERVAQADSGKRPGEPAPLPLTGTRWRILAMDGQWLRGPGRENGGSLSFAAHGWSGRAACATLNGGWREEGGRIVLTGPTSTTEQLCPPGDADTDAALLALLSGKPRWTIGPNGELLMAGADHWLVGEAER